MNEEKLHYLGNYGQCKLAKCLCIDHDTPRYDGAWGGLACPDWQPLGAVSMEQMVEYAKSNYKKAQSTNAA
jgi:hypothetical protein